LDESHIFARYDRQLRLEGWDQYRILTAKVVVAGVGALGCEVAKNLALMGVGKIFLVDNDHVELSNLSRQMLYVDDDIGRPKAVVAQERLIRMNPAIKVEAIESDIRKVEREVFEEADVILSCVDNWPTRRWINSMAVELDKPLVDVATDGYLGNVQTVIPRKTACIECHGEALIPSEVQAAECSLRKRIPENLVDDLKHKGIEISLKEAEKLFQFNIKTVYDIKFVPQSVLESLDAEAFEVVSRLRNLLNPKMPALVTVSATVAGIGSFEAVRVLHGGSLGKPFSGLLVYDGLYGRVSKVKLERLETCHVCGFSDEEPAELDVEDGMTVADLREKISNMFMFPDPVIQYGTRLLDDRSTLNELRVKDGDILFIHTSRRYTPLTLRVRFSEACDKGS